MPLRLPIMLAAVLGAAAASPGQQALDLAGDALRRVTVDREPGVYLGHVSTILLPDGSILAAYPKGHGRGPVVMKRSADGGRTWSERLPTPSSWETSKETPTLFRLRDPAGGQHRILMFSGLYPIRKATSDDDGKTWSELAPVGDWGGIVAMGFVQQFSDGRAIAMFHDDGRFFKEGGRAAKVMTLYQTESLDGGVTWTAPQTVFASDEVHLCEPGQVMSPDGRDLAVLLRENRRVKESHVITSKDQGKTWSPPREVNRALTGDRHTAKYAPDGRLVVVMRDMAKDSPTKGDWIMWVGTYADVVQGGAGQYRVRLMDNQDSWDCAYSGLELMQDGTFVAVTYGHWDKGEKPYIVCIRVRLDELDALAAPPRP